MLHSIKHFFFWLAGAGSETLEQCPNWEQRKYVAFGATVLVPCAFAFIACAYALSTITDKAAVIFPVAFIWAFIWALRTFLTLAHSIDGRYLVGNTSAGTP